MLVRFSGVNADDYSKSWDIYYNDLMNNGGDFNTVLTQLARKLNEIGDEYYADLYLPTDLKAIESQAFSGLQSVRIFVPDSVNQIGDDAFDSNVTLIVVPDSYAEAWANENNISYISIN